MSDFGKGCKVLIVDDEYIIRERLLLHIGKAGFDITAQVENGLQALEAYEREKPDIIVSDISMPAMDGIELIEKIREKDEKVKFIFLSGYSEFEYAMSALKNNASDYLLKPLDAGKLLELLQKIVSEIEEEQEMELMKREHEKLKEGNFIDQFFTQGTINDGMSKKNRQLLQDPDQQRLLMIYGKVDQIDTEHTLYRLKNDNHLTFFKGYHRTIDQVCSDNSYSALGSPCHSPQELRASYLSLRRTLLNRFFTPEQHFYKKEVTMQPEKAKLQAMILQNRKLIQERSIQEFIELIDREIAELRSPANLEYFVYLMKGLFFRESDRIIGSMISNHSPIWILEQFETLEEFKTWLKRLIEKTFVKQESRSELDLSDRVRQYLEENYTTSMSMESIAVNVFAHPNYISTRFKKEVGMTVTEYLNTLRLDRAKELLVSTELSCKQISQIVGFQDQFYFSKCFKKKFGKTPTVFQKEVVTN